MDKNTLIFLGTGTSTGVPTLGCKCDVCTSTDPNNKRYRSSILIKTKDNKQIIVDTTPDMRSQLLENKIDDIDACIITHEHADHTHGIDDLRPFCFYKDHPIPVYTNQETCDVFKTKFPYIFNANEVFKGKKILGGGIPKLNLVPISTLKKEIICGQEFTFFSLPHGHTNSLGFMTSKLAYIIDCTMIPDDVVATLKAQDLDILVIDCLRYKKHSTHLHFELALEYAKKIKAKQTIFTHMSHDFDHKKFSAEIISLGNQSVSPAFDGQMLFFT